MEMALKFRKNWKSQAKERGWLLSTISGTCAVISVICMLVGAIVAYLALVSNKVPIQQPAALFAAGLLVLVATHSMWNYERWGRNIAVAVTFCLAWVMTEAICRRYGWGLEAKMPTVLFGALCLSYFTSSQGRYLFRKRDPGEEVREMPKPQTTGNEDGKDEVVG